MQPLRSIFQLTLHSYLEHFAVWGDDPVGGNAQIFAHVESAHFWYSQMGAFNNLDCNMMCWLEACTATLYPHWLHPATRLSNLCSHAPWWAPHPLSSRPRVASGARWRHTKESGFRSRALQGPSPSRGSISSVALQNSIVCPWCSHLMIPNCCTCTRLTHHLEVALPVHHGVRVDLAHVPTAVWLLRALHMEMPLLCWRSWEGDPWISRDDIVVDRQYRLRVDAYPGNLRAYREKQTNLSRNHNACCKIEMICYART